MFRPLLISLCLTSTALATTWTVDDDGKADFDNIQAAVDAASDGDEIIVMPGTYTSTQDGHVVNMLGKSVWLHSSNGPKITVIDGQKKRRGFVCVRGEGQSTKVEGFTVTNGYSVGYDYNDNGQIDYNENDGGGFLCIASSPTVTDCVFDGNIAFGSNAGGAIWCDGESNLVLSGCTIINNTAAASGGIGIRGSSPTITNCVILSNVTSGFAGGVWVLASSPTLTNCTISGNSAITQGGGIYSSDYSSSSLTNCTIEGNTADYGGGMYNTGSSPTLIDCTFTDNTAPYGGGMRNSNSSPTLTNCTFTNNSAYNGGGILNYQSSTMLTDTTVCGNTPNQIYGDWTDNGGNLVADECPLDCPDISGDGIVDVSDLLIVIAYWGLTNSPADVNDDGIVDVSDLLIVVGKWGPCE